MAVPGDGPMMFPAGFGKAAALAVAVNGQTSDALTYSWKQVAGPTELAPTVDPTDGSKASITMPKFAPVSVGEDAIGVQVPGRFGLLPVSTEQAIAMIYQYEVTVSDGTFTSKAVVAAAPSMVTQSLPRVGVGSMVIANDVVAPDAAHAWSLAGPGTPALDDVDTKNRRALLAGPGYATRRAAAAPRLVSARGGVMDKVGKGSVVSLDYELHLGDGKVVDASAPGEPLAYIHGEGQIVPGLERALEGLSPGDARQVVVEPGDGYGEHDPRGVQEVPRSAFPPSVELAPGMELAAQGEDGQAVPFLVREVKPESVVIDMNHPLAGRTLHFAVKVKDIRAATEDELAHGHVHGAGGHAHE